MDSDSYANLCTPFMLTFTYLVTHVSKRCFMKINVNNIKKNEIVILRKEDKIFTLILLNS